MLSIVDYGIFRCWAPVLVPYRRSVISAFEVAITVTGTPHQLQFCRSAGKRPFYANSLMFRIQVTGTQHLYWYWYLSEICYLLFQLFWIRIRWIWVPYPYPFLSLLTCFNTVQIKCTGTCTGIAVPVPLKNLA